MKILLALVLCLFAISLFSISDAEARRFGGGMSLGKQFKSAPRRAPQGAQQAAPANRAGTAAARSSGASRWLGPLAGLAAGGLLASLFFGDAFEGLQIMDMLLIGGLIFGALMLFKAMRQRTPAAAGSGAGYGGAVPGGPVDRMSPDQGTGVAADFHEQPDEVPVWFDGPGFLEGAKTHFIRLQAAWDQADFRDIREYTTPQMFAELQRERNQLGEAPQYTEVVTLEGELLSVRRDADQVVASLVFSGLIREQQDASANPFREIWHVQHDWESREGDWLICGIQQDSGQGAA